MSSLAFSPIYIAGARSPGYTIPDHITTFMADVGHDAVGINVDMNSATPGSITPTGITNTIGSGPVQGMRQDYYDHVHILPSLFNLKSPPLNIANPYAIWNAFLVSNTITAMTSTGAAGLTNSFSPPSAFRGGELKEGYGVTITAAAPAQIDAIYSFISTFETAKLLFKAVQSYLFNFKPEVPVKLSLKYRTDTHESYNGALRRIALSSAPRRTYQFKIELDNDDDINRLRGMFMFNRITTFQIPVWEAPFYLTSQATANSYAIQADFTLADIKAGDLAYVTTTDGATYEQVEVDTITDSLLTTKTQLAHAYALGSEVYQLQSGQALKSAEYKRRHYATAQMGITFTLYDTVSLGGKNGTFPSFDNFLVLQDRPLGEKELPEDFRVNSEVIDFGNKIDFLSAESTANITQSRAFMIRSRQEMQNWKVFVDSIIGMRDVFLSPTWRDDFALYTQPPQASSSFLIEIKSLYTTMWAESTSHTRIQLDTGDGIIYRIISSITDNLDGTARVNLTSALPNTPEGSTIKQISFLEQVTLAKDTVQFSHMHRESYVDFKIVTVK